MFHFVKYLFSYPHTSESLSSAMSSLLNKPKRSICSISFFRMSLLLTFEDL